VFIDLIKSFDLMDRERCLQLLEEYRVGSNMSARDPIFLQRGIDVLVDIFARVGLETNIVKTQAKFVHLGRSVFSSWQSHIGGCRLVGFQRQTGMPAKLPAESAGR
jgi:hypothetical protein